jgi:PPM family protein phosphatase
MMDMMDMMDMMEKRPTVQTHGISERLYHLILRAYPRPFRDEYAAEMLLVFRDAQADANGGWSLLRLWRDVIADVTASLYIQWCAHWMSRTTTSSFAGKEQLAMTLPFTLNVAQQTDTGRTRSSNEDNLIVVMPQNQELVESKGSLFVVSDGLGGHSRGEVASQLAVQTVNETYYQEVEKDVPTALKDALSQANRIIYQAGKEQEATGDACRMGATCVATVLHEHTLYAANVGDSRVYVGHGGELRQITRDHSLVAQMVERGELTAAEARTHEQRNIIYRALGSEAEVEVDLFTEPVAEGDIILLCTDGLSAVVPEEDVQAIVEQYTPTESVERLIARANDVGGPDNVTAIVVRVSAA